MKNSIDRKLAKSSLLLLSMTLFLFMAVAIWLSVLNSSIQQEHADAAILAELNARGIALVLNHSRALSGLASDYAFTDVGSLVKESVSDDPTILFGAFFDAQGNVWVSHFQETSPGLTTGQSVSELFGGHLPSWELSPIEPIQRTLNYKGTQFLEFAAPVRSHNEVLGYIRYGLSSHQADALRKVAEERNQTHLIFNLYVLGIVWLGVIAVGYAMSRRFAKRITTPLELLTSAAGQIVEGRYDTAINTYGDDEIAMLARRFDIMRIAIHRKVHDLSTINSASEAIFSKRLTHDAVDAAFHSITQNMEVMEIALYLKVGQTPYELVKDTGGFSEAQHNSIVRSLGKAESTPFCLQNFYVLPLKESADMCGAFVLFLDSTRELSNAHRDFCHSVCRSLLNAIKNIRMREVIEQQNRNLEITVDHRTRALTKKKNDIESMLNNLQQGLFIIETNLRVHQQYALFLEEILGTKDIAGRLFFELLFDRADISSENKSRIKSAAHAVLGLDVFMYELNSHHFINQYQLEVKGKKKTLLLQWNPITHNDIVEQLMVSVQDITQINLLQIQAIEQQEELSIIGQMLAVNESYLTNFILDTKQLLQASETGLTQTLGQSNLLCEEISKTLGVFHTIKGNARVFDFTYLTNMVHEVESTYAVTERYELHTEAQMLLEDTQKIMQEVKRYQAIAEQKLHRDFSQKNNSTEPQTLFDILRPLTFALPKLAQSAGKETPKFRLRGGFLNPPPNWASALRGVVMHIVNNSIVHGIESNKARKALGKEEQGIISIIANNENSLFTMRIYDDGQGVDIVRLQQRFLEETGAILHEDDHEAIKNYLFKIGYSSATESSLSAGRGVGLNAAQMLLAEIGGEIEIEFKNSSTGKNGHTQRGIFKNCLFKITIKAP